MAKKEKYHDDGHTIYNMDVEGMPHRRRHNKTGIELTKEERRALVKAGFLHYLPIIFVIMLSFGLTLLLIYFWLR